MQYIKVKYPDLITGKPKGTAYQSCNVSFQWTNKIGGTFHNVRGYDDHLIVQEIGKSDGKIIVKPNGMEKI